MRSMTGIGHATAREGKLALTLEIRSVNHRFLDLAFRVPSAFSEFEPLVRDRLQAEIDRGRVTVNFDFEQRQPQLEVRFHEPFVEAFVKEARRVARKHGLQDDLSVKDLAGMTEAFVVREKEIPQKLRRGLLDQALDKALQNFQRMRETEGRKLGKDLASGLKKIEVQMKVVRKHADSIAGDVERRLKERLERAGAADVVDPQRLAAEVALLADKATIREEIERMDSHLAQFHDALKEKGPVSKRLGFLLQEMHREVNTTGSKSNDLRVTDAVVRMKEQLENLREQIANVE